MADYIDRQAVLDELKTRQLSASEWYNTAKSKDDEEIMVRADAAIGCFIEAGLIIKKLPSADVEPVVRCRDCIFGYKYFDVINGITDSWIECRNPNGLNRDVSCDGYCSAGENGG